MLNKLIKVLKVKGSIFLALIALVVLQGCHVPIIHFLNAGKGEKDVSDNFERGHVVGKEYELVRDLYLTQLEFSENIQLDEANVSAYCYKNDKKIEINVYLIKKAIPKGTRFKVCSVFVATAFGSELCRQRICANFIDENGCILPERNFKGKVMPIDVSYVFKSPFQKSNENWVFLPHPDLVREICDSIEINNDSSSS